MYYRHYTKRFQKSLQNVLRSGKVDESAIEKVVTLLASSNALEAKYRDHQLTGDLKHYRECHIRGDILLLYYIQNDRLVLVLADIGTHSYLGL